MTDITRLNINGTFYDIKDEVARNLITKLQNEGYIKASDMKTYVDNAIKNIEITTKTFEYMKRHPNPFYQPEMNTKEFQDNDQNTNIIVTADTKDEESITKKD